MSIFVRRHWRKLAIAAVSAPILGFFGLCLIIGLGVHLAVSNAQSNFPGEPVAALVAVVNSDDSKLSERNRAIWALGQLGSPEALPFLQSLVTGEPCDHDSKLCQHELETAIEGCSGSPNVGAFVWRHGNLAVANSD